MIKYRRRLIPTTFSDYPTIGQQMMLKIYKYLYFQLFLLWSKKVDERENARINAVITLTFVIYINMLEIKLFLHSFFLNSPGCSINVDNVHLYVGVPFLVFGLINWLLLGRIKAHKRVAETFSSRQGKNGQLLIVIYQFISFGLPLNILFTV